LNLIKIIIKFKGFLKQEFIMKTFKIIRPGTIKMALALVTSLTLGIMPAQAAPGSDGVNWQSRVVTAKGIGAPKSQPASGSSAPCRNKSGKIPCSAQCT
ncbi:MAG: hypothetical protein ABIA63_10750, partial [bacterium]